LPHNGVFVVPPGVRHAILTCALAEHPRECCGLLLGTSGRAFAAWPARNLAETPTTRYRVDPAEHFAALRYARARGLDVVGAYHSHPRTGAVPSERDLTEALSDFVYVIVGPLSDGRPAPVSAWWLAEGNFVEIRLVPE